jgi:hypothetical protein
MALNLNKFYIGPYLSFVLSYKKTLWHPVQHVGKSTQSIGVILFVPETAQTFEILGNIVTSPEVGDVRIHRFKKSTFWHSTYNLKLGIRT